MTDEDIERFKKLFFEEAQELITQAEDHLNSLASGSYEDEDIHALFRCIHSIKGGSGTFGFKNLINFAHAYETLLGALREGRIPLESSLCDTLLIANDILHDLIDLAFQNREHEALDGAKETAQQLLKLANGGTGSSTPEKTISVSNDTPSSDLQNFSITFLPHEDLMHLGSDPLLILKELKRLAEPDSFKLKVCTEKLPTFESMNFQDCYLSWTIEGTTKSSMKDIRELFEFVEHVCDLSIDLFPQGQSSAAPQGNENAVSPSHNNVHNTEAPVTAEHATSESSDTSHPTSHKDKKENQNSFKEEAVQSIRVDLDRIDRLVNTVGEMVIKQSMILDQANVLGDALHGDFIKGLNELTQHTRDLQESVMAIRAQPVKAVFSRMPRLVRELSKELDKDVALIMNGENTEIDKTVIERLGEPLTHMIRNSLDHGIESAEEREKQGKPKQGKILLSAEHKSGRIVIHVEDDGRGINRQKVLEKAVKQELITPDTTLTEEEIDQLIFLPGFSTAAQVTNISGRGVGMDVVKKSIQNLGGRINISSHEGKGTRFSLSLPLTLAVLDGMIVTSGTECYVIPLINIIETLKPKQSQIHPLVGHCDILYLRQQNIPLIYLKDIFPVSGAVERATQGVVVILETEGDEPMGLVVDDLIGEQQVVIKSLEDNYDPIPGISAATILGNGRVALILDVLMLKDLSRQNYYIPKFDIGSEDPIITEHDSLLSNDASDSLS